MLVPVLRNIMGYELPTELLDVLFGEAVRSVIKFRPHTVTMAPRLPAGLMVPVLLMAMCSEIQNLSGWTLALRIPVHHK